MCPFCRSEDTRVLDSRYVREQQSTRRRRSCNSCGRRFTTYERVERLLPVIVKRDGSREPFNRDKLRVGLQIACRKRPVNSGDIEALITRVEQHFAEAAEREVPSRELGHYVLSCMKELDEVAYVRFASVYREFTDVGQFLTELEVLQDPASATTSRTSD